MRNVITQSQTGSPNSVIRSDIRNNDSRCTTLYRKTHCHMDLSCFFQYVERLFTQLIDFNNDMTRFLEEFMKMLYLTFPMYNFVNFKLSNFDMLSFQQLSICKGSFDKDLGLSRFWLLIA